MACTQVRALSAHARQGGSRLGSASFGMARPGLTGLYKGTKAGDWQPPGFEAPAPTVATCGYPGLPW